ncbi:MAG: type II toxin-antitoxin system death-on-curing family toxin [Patescibacteria group bacterium]
MRYLSAEEILVLHAFIINETSGSHGLRDVGLLQSIVHKPQASFAGKELYTDVFIKAAVLLEAIANYHVFIDGNKRTSFASATRFLYINGYEVIMTNEDVENTIVKIATKEMVVSDIAVWLKKNSKKIKKI